MYPALANQQLTSVFYEFYTALKEKKEDLSSHLLLLLSVLGDKHMRIWITDDDSDDRELFIEAMEAIAPNIKITPIPSGSAMMKKLADATELPEIIFLDLNMPQKSGLECLEELRRNTKFKNIAIVIYSTSTNQMQIEQTYNSGANFYIQKPQHFEGIKNMLHKMLSLDLTEYFPQPSRSKFVVS